MRSAIMLVLGLAAGAGAATPAKVADEVVTKKLTVVDDAGNPRAIVSTSATNVMVSLHMPNRGGPRVALALSNDGAANLIFYDKNEQRVNLTLKDSRGGGLLLFDAAGNVKHGITEGSGAE